MNPIELIKHYELDKKLSEYQLKALEQDLDRMITDEAYKILKSLGRTLGGHK